MKMGPQAALAAVLLLGLTYAQPTLYQRSDYEEIDPVGSCGIANSKRILGGTPVEYAGKWPWLAALSPNSGEDFFVVCGGTLITTRHVLTAAHCYNGTDDPIYARFGENDLSSHTEGNYPKDYYIESRAELGYSEITYLDDIELLILSETVVFTYLVRPACLPTSSFSDINFENTLFSAIGWGATVHEGKTSTVARYVELPNVDIDECATIYADDTDVVVDPKLFICAGNDKVDTCPGDSGGPLQYLNEEDGRYYVVGVVSRGMKCANPDHPGLYARVDGYMDWINAEITSTSKT